MYIEQDRRFIDIIAHNRKEWTKKNTGEGLKMTRHDALTVKETCRWLTIKTRRVYCKRNLSSVDNKDKTCLLLKKPVIG